MCFHRPQKELLRQRPRAVGLPTRWPCLCLWKALPEVWARSHLTSSALQIPCSCMCAHVLASAGTKTVTSSALSLSPTKYPPTLGKLVTGHPLRAMERDHSCISQPFAIWLPPHFSTQHPPSLPPCPPNYLCQHMATLLSREPMHHVPFPLLAPSLSNSRHARNAHTPHTPGMVSFYLHSII